MANRKLLPNIKLENRIFGIRPKDFWLKIMPQAVLFHILNLYLIVRYSIFSIPLIVVTVLAVGIPFILCYEYEYNYRVYESILKYLEYEREGDRLYEASKEQER